MAIYDDSRQIEPAMRDRLQLLDSQLWARWNRTSERWEIWRGDKPVMVVQTTEGNYCPVDNRALQKLFLGDTHRYRDKFEFIRTLRLEDERLMSMKRKEQDEFIRACHRDMAPFLRGRKSVTSSRKEHVNPSRTSA